MTKPEISFCIPTYNRANYLEQTLNSIVSQINDNNRELVEIAISDNASTDNTDEIIEKYQDKVKIIYNKNPENLGADKNYLKCAEIATGKFGWFFGSDDLLPEGSIDYVLEELKSDNEIYLADRYVADINMQNPKEHHFTNYPRKKQVYDFKNDKDLIEYFNSVNSLAGVFSYLSSIIFKKSSWDAVEYDEKYTGTAYSHVFVLLSFIKQQKCKLQYLEKCLPLARTGNDSFLENKNILKRWLIDYIGYSILADDLFNYSQKVKDAFLEIMIREHEFKYLLSVLIMTKVPKSDWIKLSNIIEKYPYKKYQKLMIKYFNIYGRIHYIILYFYKLFLGKKTPNLKNIFNKNICYVED